MVYAIWQIGPTNTNRETLLQREYRLQYRNSTSTTHEIENTSLTLYFEFVVIADVTCLTASQRATGSRPTSAQRTRVQRE